MSERDTLDMLLHEYNPRCNPPWSERELAHKAQQAITAGVKQGYLIDERDDWRAADRFPPIPDEPEPCDILDREPGDDTEEIETEARAPEFQIVTLHDACKAVWDAANEPRREPGYTTGLTQIDTVLGGLRQENITLFAAGTSFGKSTFAVMVADENIKKGVPTLVVSCEDTQELYAKRIIARRGELSALNLRDLNLSPQELIKLGEVASAAEQVPFFLNCIGKPVEWAARGVAHAIDKLGVKLVLVDYLQRFRADRRTQDRRNELTYVMAVLADAIKNGKAAGLLMSQLRRIEGRLPAMDDIKESGDLENMADNIILGYRREHVDGRPGGGTVTTHERFLLVPKNKDGPVHLDPQPLTFDTRTASFVDSVAQNADAYYNGYSDDFKTLQ